MVKTSWASLWCVYLEVWKKKTKFEIFQQFLKSFENEILILKSLAFARKSLQIEVFH